MNILNSGGAKGADSLFGVCANDVGHIVRHYSFIGHDTDCFDVVLLSELDLLRGDVHLLKANEKLHRHFPSKSNYVNNLLRRNFWQLHDTEAVFAVAPLKDEIVQGGTAWAVQMAIDLRINPIYLFDMNSNRWHQYFYLQDKWEYIPESYVNKPKVWNVYTGIGSRELTVQGCRAIADLYQ